MKAFKLFAPESPRARFILCCTLGYFVLAMVWIFLSDSMLSSVIDPHDVVWMSNMKGAFFVTATSLLFLLALRIVPTLPEAHGTSVLSLVADGVNLVSRPGPVTYLMAIVLPLSMLLMRQAVGGPTPPSMILLVIPVLLSALFGGLLPGMLSTAIAVFGSVILTGSQGLEWPQDRHLLAMAVLLGCGVAVSILSELRRRAQARAQANRDLLNAVVSGTTDAVFIKDTQGRYLLINDAGAHMVNRMPQDIVGVDDTRFFPSADAADLMASDKAIMERALQQTHEETLTLPDGVKHVFLVTKGPVFNRKGDVQGIFGIAHDITERKQAELEQRKSNTVFDGCHEGIMVVDPQRRILKVNPAFSRITGYSAEEVLGQMPQMLSSGKHDSNFFRSMWTDIREKGSWRGEIWNRRKSGEVFAELLSITEVRNAEGALEHYVGAFTDISKYKAHDEELNRIAHYDSLTGLPNRRLLSDRLEQALRSCARSNRMMAVCFLDLDGFKDINDLHGHAIGDTLLIGVARHLADELRADDTLARLGGDEFALLLTNMESLEDCSTALDRILLAVAKPVQLEHGCIGVTASIGVALFPQDNGDADSLLRHADQAMYVAKESGRNRYHLFDPESDRLAQQHRKMLDVLGTALQLREFVLYYQPKVDLVSGSCVGAEALIRWNHPQQGVLSPATFMDHVTGSKLEQPLGEWVIESAMAQAEDWYVEGLDLCISVNISAHHLLHPDFCRQLQDALLRHPQLPPGNFELEILETASVGDMEQAVALVAQCKQLGVRFSLDDFGTGYSSLSYLRRLPVDELKIDQSFVREMLTNADDRGIVQAVVKLAKVFNREVIAEGVETMDHCAALLSLGCHHVQGYGIARPMPAEKFKEWVSNWHEESSFNAVANSI